MSDEVFLGVMDHQDAKNHQVKLKSAGVNLILKSNPKTCTSGCKVTVELWGRQEDEDKLKMHFMNDYQKHVKGHEPNPEHLGAIYDPTAEEVICQACGAKFSPVMSECPDCGLCY